MDVDDGPLLVACYVLCVSLLWFCIVKSGFLLTATDLNLFEGLWLFIGEHFHEVSFGDWLNLVFVVKPSL